MNAMDTVKKDQKIQIGKHTCNVIQSCNSWWCSCHEASSNESIFTQFNITKEEIEKVLGYSSHGAFPQCRSAEDLTKVIEFILSKEPANQTKKEDYTGRTIKALVNNPDGTRVKLGEEIKIVKKSNYYVLDKTATGRFNMWTSYPLDLKIWELLPEESVKKVEESPNIDMKAIQEECKKRFPIGCKYIPVQCTCTYTLLQDDRTYKISDNYIYAHHMCGYLYDNGEWATLVSLPEEKVIKPNFIVGKWYKYHDWYIKYKQTTCGMFKSSEQINVDKRYYKGTGSFGTSNHEKILLEDLSEIQQYLPEGHPDKIQVIPEYVEYVPQIGDYVVMEKAGGWDYNHDNNGCIAVVKRVGTIELSCIGHVTCIDGTIINPKVDSYIEFEDIPIKNNDKETVFRKALPHEYEHLLSKQEVKSETMFKKGDYIVTLEGHFFDTLCAKKNYCFKQRLNGHYLRPEKDLDGSKTNRNTNLTFDKHLFLKDWRYATAREIAEYDRLGVPYDVTTLYPKLTEKIKEGIENTTLQERDAVYAYVGDPLPTTKPLIENVQSVSVNLRTKKNNNKFKI